MAGDLGTNERAILDGDASERARADADGPGRTIHRYGRLRIVAEPGAEDAGGGGEGVAAADLTDLERMGLEALRRRESEEYREGKRQRPRAGEAWDMAGCTNVRPPDVAEPTATARRSAAAEAGEEEPVGPTSSYLEGNVAVAVVFVHGPGPALTFSDAEMMTVVAEIQNGLGWLALSNPLAQLSFTYEIEVVRLTVPPDPNAPSLEQLWRGPTLQALGYDEFGAYEYVQDVRARLGTRWVYAAFVTKYPLDHFAYAYLGGPYLVMEPGVDGWGPENFDRVFAHETGHIFNAPDEYASSGCTCGEAFGRFGVANGNCENCAPGFGVPCIMKANDFTMCEYTTAHLGWSFTTPLFARHSGKVLDVAGASTANGALVHQWEWWGGDNQRWRIEALGNGTVRVVAVHSGKVLDVDHASTADGTAVVQWAWSNTNNQRWVFDRFEFGDEIRLLATHSLKPIEVAGRSEANGAPVVQREWWGGPSQRWVHQIRRLVAKHSGRVMTARGYSPDEGAPIVQWEWWGGENQRWCLESVGNGDVKITSLFGVSLTVENDATHNGARLVQQYWTGKDSQRFRIEDAGAGSFRLVARHSGKVLDVSDISQVDGAQIHQWDWLGADNQRWHY